MPMLYREAPLNSIWEGSGNIICLDLLRSLEREPEAKARLRDELEAARGRSAVYATALDGALARWPDLPPEAEARWFTERLAMLLAASLLLRSEEGAVAEAFGYYFDREGTCLYTASSVGVDLGRLKPNCLMIAVAAGEKKAEAMIAVLRHYRHEMLVTDEGAARRIVELLS